MGWSWAAVILISVQICIYFVPGNRCTHSMQAFPAVSVPNNQQDLQTRLTRLASSCLALRAGMAVQAKASAGGEMGGASKSTVVAADDEPKHWEVFEEGPISIKQRFPGLTGRVLQDKVWATYASAENMCLKFFSPTGPPCMCGCVSAVCVMCGAG